MKVMKAFEKAWLMALMLFNFNCGTWKYMGRNTYHKTLNTFIKEENANPPFVNEQKREIKFYMSTKDSKFEINGYIESYNIKHKVIIEKEFENLEVEDCDVYKFEPWPDWVCYLPSAVLGITGLIGMMVSSGIKNTTGLVITSPMLSASLLSFFPATFCASAEKKIKYETIKKNFLTKSTGKETTKRIPIEAKLIAKQGVEGIVRVVAESINLDSNIELKNGVGYIITDEIVSYKSFVKKKGIVDFASVCDLEEVYKNLPEKTIDFSIFYEGKKYEAKIKVKDGSKKAIDQALKKANCY